MNRKIVEFIFWDLLENTGTENDEGPSKKFLKILDMGSISSRRREVEVWWYGIIETLKLWNQETKKPRHYETRKPRNQETKNLRNQEAKKPTRTRNHETDPLPLNIPTHPCTRPP